MSVLLVYFYLFVFNCLIRQAFQLCQFLLIYSEAFAYLLALFIHALCFMQVLLGLCKEASSGRSGVCPKRDQRIDAHILD